MDTLTISSRRRHSLGLSLIELMVVVAIIILLLGLSIPTASRMLGSRHLAQGTIDLVDALNIGRQTAISQNMPTRFQIFKIPDPRNGEDAAFRLVRVDKFVPASRTWVPVKNWKLLPLRVFVSEEPDSTLVGGSALPLEALDYQGRTITAEVCRIVFDPNGRARLNPNEPHVFLVKETQSDANFSIIQLDPITGNTRVYRP